MVAVQVARRSGAQSPGGPRAWRRSSGGGHLHLVTSADPPQRLQVGPVGVAAAPGQAAVYRRRRAVALAGLVLLLAGLWFAVQAAVGGAGSGPLTAAGAAAGVPVAARVWVVRPGDTLWTIALASGATGDIRPLVDRLAAETGNRPLQVGEQVLLP